MDVYRKAQSECDYNVTYFLRMIGEHGGLETARQLLRKSEVSSGFTALWECERLDLSVEAVVLKEQGRPLSTDEELCTARTRLVDVGCSVDNLIPRGYVRPSWRKLSRERLSLSRR